MKIKTRWGEIPVHPAADLFPLMGEAELKELADDIKQRGLQEPIPHDKDGLILDGRNRLLGCSMAAVRPRYQCRKVTDPVAFVIAANIHRRHLTPEQKTELTEKLLKLDPGKSDRQIAKQAKVDHKTVAKTRAKAESRGDIPHVEKRTDSKGRKQPAKKTAGAKAAATRQKNRKEQERAKAERSKARAPFLDQWCSKARDLFIAAANDLKSHGYNTPDDTSALCRDMREAMYNAKFDLPADFYPDNAGDGSRGVPCGSEVIPDDERRAQMEKLSAS